MMSNAKGYLRTAWLTLFLLTTLQLELVVSRNPKQQQQQRRELFNEGLVEKQSTNADLIARLEKHDSTLHSPALLDLSTRARRTAPTTLYHQQSTNTASAKRESFFKPPYHSRGARALVGDASIIQESHVRGGFLPGQINSLTLGKSENEISSFQPPKIVYLDSALPQPFARPEQQATAQAIARSSFLRKDTMLMEPTGFAFLNGVERTAEEDEISIVERPSSNVPEISAQLTSMIANILKGDVSPINSLFHRIIDEENNDGEAARSFEVNSVAEESVVVDNQVISSAATTTTTTTTTARAETSNVDVQDWESSASNIKIRQVMDSCVKQAPSTNVRKQYQKRHHHQQQQQQPQRQQQRQQRRQPKQKQQQQKQQEQADDDQPKQYDFGYRVIDHGVSSDFGHQETHQGPATSGHYHVLLPDGRTQHVKYYADQAGYHADITYTTATAAGRGTSEK